MNLFRHSVLFTHAVFELLRYDVLVAARGFEVVRRQLSQPYIPSEAASPEAERAVSDAVMLATCFYWKPVLCLQRSACLVRMLRQRGIWARLAIGYRSEPFFSHAWAEVDGRVLDSSAGYQNRLHLLCKL